MLIGYRLRLNHHADDHGRLMIEGLRPAVDALRTFPWACRVAIRSHWRGGPHILVGFDATQPASADRAVGLIGRRIADWFAESGVDTVSDPARYERLADQLALAEGLQVPAESLHTDRTVETGNYAVPAPFGNEVLAAVRDAFEVRALDTIFDLIAMRLQSPANALVELAGRFVAMERLSWADSLPLWPLSLRGQARIGLQVYPEMASKFPGMRAKLEPYLLALIAREHLVGGQDLGPCYKNWVSLLQETYDELVHFTRQQDDGFFESLKVPDHHSAEFSRLHGEMDAGRVNEILTDRRHFPYRMLINFMYNMVSQVGFPPGRRFFIAYIINCCLEDHYPDVLAEALAAGAML